jgi:hypothetical protein
LAVNVPHHSYSLYVWLIALTVRWFGISPIAALSIAGLINAALLLLWFPLAISALSGRKDLSFYSLLFSLLFWGPKPWRYSGFLNLNSLAFTLPYPSMFATAIAFLVIGITPVLLQNSTSWWRVIPVGMLVFLVVNSHPITGAGLIAACLALTVSHRANLAGWLKLSIATAGGLVAAILWPLFPFLALVFEGSRDIDVQNRLMYLGLLCTAPALLGFPLLVRRVTRSPLDPLGVLFGVLLGIYVAGWVASRWTLGRVIPFLVLPLFTCLAGWVVDQEVRAAASGAVGMRGPMRVRAIVAGVLILTSVNVVLGLAPLARAVPRSWLPVGVRSDSRLGRPAEVFRVLGPVLSDCDVVIAAPEISFIIPTFGGKVVSSRPQPFVHDWAERVADVERFFTTSDKIVALAILKKYGVTKIVVDKSNVGWQGHNIDISRAVDAPRFRKWGVILFTNDRFEVISLRERMGSAFVQGLERPWKSSRRCGI